MLITKKMLLALTLVGALLGAGIGALISHSATASSAATTGTAATNTTDANYKTPEQVASENSSQFKTPEEQAAYREGFNEGYSSCGSSGTDRSSRTLTSSTARRSSGRVYYDYSSPRGRTFWQKHRDKLTLAIGTGLGAAIGGIAGGKKGAGIGSLAGLGSSALYTYKLRKRSRRY
jgi:uncharacterized protein YcfJ